ncbi:ROK family transcriptional regulator [Mycolicibacterium sp. 050158]|uniref:ROK family transcriptional regulator n=1 Tax=Mycolicibacterium sp. 050158 TaxID=3090602 RepID=UPI00299D14D1|nr:ROK family protein [Mycolicibacterium sp. 050158]MDX1891192.1 ROK family protein [Mycolicibacterium sp. 050158]
MADQAAPQAGTPAAMRALNQRLVLNRLRDHGEATRPQIALDTGLSKPTVGQALLDLEQHGLVCASGRSAPRPGRSAVVYRTAPEAGYIVGIDVGRRVLHVAVADLDGTIVARLEEPNRSRSGATLRQTVERTVREAVARAGLDERDIVVTVVGTPGVPDPVTGTVHRAPNLPGWERRGLLRELVSALEARGSEVIVENDANLCAIGEHARGAARGFDVVACLTVGTGIGMGIVINGKLFRGAHGAAGEIADLPFGRVPAGATARRPGPVEVVAAGQAVVAAARESGLPSPTAKAVFDSARAGDERALRVVEGEAVKLAHVVSVVTTVLDPGVIVLAGGIGHNADLLTEPMRRELLASVPVVPHIVGGHLGDDAVLVGAIATAMDTAWDLVFDRRVLGLSAGSGA